MGCSITIRAHLYKLRLCAFSEGQNCILHLLTNVISKLSGFFITFVLSSNMKILRYFFMFASSSDTTKPNTFVCAFLASVFWVYLLYTLGKEFLVAIYHCSVKIISRSSGRSSVGAAAYRAGEKLYNKYDGVLHDYTHKGGIVHTEIILAQNAPVEFYNREVLWNSVEQSEKRINSQTAREVEVALPSEFTREQQLDILRSYINNSFVSKGMCADFSVHDKNDGNPHAHIMLTTREVTSEGFTVKNRDWNNRELLESWRGAWADICNKKFEEINSSERIDHRSYKEQGINKEPTIHLGAAAKLESRGIKTDRGSINEDIAKRNAEYEIDVIELIREISILRKNIMSEDKADYPTDSESIYKITYTELEKEIEILKSELYEFKEISEVHSYKTVEAYSEDHVEKYGHEYKSDYSNFEKEIDLFEKSLQAPLHEQNADTTETSIEASQTKTADEIAQYMIELNTKYFKLEAQKSFLNQSLIKYKNDYKEFESKLEQITEALSGIKSLDNQVAQIQGQQGGILRFTKKSERQKKEALEKLYTQAVVEFKKKYSADPDQAQPIIDQLRISADQSLSMVHQVEAEIKALIKQQKEVRIYYKAEDLFTVGRSDKLQISKAINQHNGKQVMQQDTTSRAAAITTRDMLCYNFSEDIENIKAEFPDRADVLEEEKDTTKPHVDMGFEMGW